MTWSHQTEVGSENPGYLSQHYVAEMDTINEN